MNSHNKKSTDRNPLHSTLLLDCLMRWTSMDRIATNDELREFLFRVALLMDIGEIRKQTGIIDLVAVYGYDGKNHHFTTTELAKYIGFFTGAGKKNYLPRESFLKSTFIKSPGITPEIIEGAEQSAAILMDSIAPDAFDGSNCSFVEMEMSFQPYYQPENPAIFRKGNLFGIKTPEGEVIVPPLFEDFMTLPGMELKEGVLVVAQKNGGWGILIGDSKLKWLVKPDYEYIGVPNDLTHFLKDGKWGIMNIAEGKWLVEPECEEIPSWNGFIFSNGVAFYKKEGKWGVVLQWGQMTKSIFDEYAGDTDEGWVEVNYNGEWGFINEQNEFTTDEEYAYYRYSSGCDMF